MKLWHWMVLCSVLCVQHSAKAHGVDLSGITNLLSEQLTEETAMATGINELQTVSNETKTLLDTDLSKEIDELSGHSGFGDLYNDLESKEWSSEQWLNVLNDASGDLKTQTVHYQALNPTVDASVIDENDTKSMLAETYTQQSEESTSALALSSASYDQIQSEQEELHTLTEDIEKADTLKASMDLDARITAEVGYAVLELLKLQSATSNVAGMQMQAQVNRETEDARYFSDE